MFNCFGEGLNDCFCLNDCVADSFGVLHLFVDLLLFLSLNCTFDGAAVKPVTILVDAVARQHPYFSPLGMCPEVQHSDRHRIATGGGLWIDACEGLKGKAQAHRLVVGRVFLCFSMEGKVFEKVGFG